MTDKLLKQSIQRLEIALKIKEVDDLHFDAICKRFEVCFEYTWKYLKRQASDAGQEVYSPKDAIKEGVKLKIIDNLDLWLDCLQERNLSVHNYYSSDPQETLKKIKQFLKEVKKIKI